jgi:hypothetical protein
MGTVTSALSSAAATWIAGLGIGSQIAVVGGSLIVVVALSYGGYKLYKYCTKSETMHQCEVEQHE